MRKLILIAASAAAAFATACSEEGKNQPAGEGGAIDFRVLIDKGASRATTIETLADLHNFYVAAAKEEDIDFTFLEAAVRKEGTSWVYAPKKYYPTDGKEVSFFAHYPIKDLGLTTTNGTDATFDYTVPTGQNLLNQHAEDLLVAAVLGKTDDGADVAFEFFHALSAVTFSASNGNAATSELTYVIESVQLKGLVNEGTFTYADFADADAVTAAWAQETTLVNYIADLPEAGVSLVGGAAEKKLLAANDVMMVLPQAPTNLATAANIADGDDISAMAYVEVTYNLKDGAGQAIYPVGSKLNLPLPATFAFKAGTRYNFLFEFDASNAITMTVTSVADWTPDNVEIPE